MKTDKTHLPLTEREKTIWDYLIFYFSQNHIMPTRQEIAKAIGIESFPNAIQRISASLKNMQEKGVLKLDGSKRRGITLK